MKQVTLISMDNSLKFDYTLLVAKKFKVFSRHRHVLNLQLFNKKIVSLVELSVPQAPRQLRLLNAVPTTNEFTLPTRLPQTFCCDLRYSSTTLNSHLLDMAWNMLIHKRCRPTDFVQLKTQQYLQAGIADLLQALKWQKPLDNEVKRLLGLGQGLTPSGDDFLCGLMITLCLPQSPFYGQREILRDAILMPVNKKLTNPISIGFLQDACFAQVSLPVQQFIRNLLSPVCDVSVIEQITALGHRSGYDLLSGLLAGLPHESTKRVHLCPYIVD